MWWSENDDSLEPVCDTRTYFEATSGIREAIQTGSTPFNAPRWNYLREDLARLRQYVSSAVTGKVIDLGCGAGHWIDHYGASAIGVDLVDFSPALLAQAVQRANNRWPHLQVDAWPVDLADPCNNIPFAEADSIVAAFLLSHFESEDVVKFQKRLRAEMKPGSTLLVIDSWHSPKRRRYRPRETVRFVEIDGRRVSTRKHYFGREEWECLAARAGFEIVDSWWGHAFFMSRLRICP